jgi:tRNA pseudouridine38-40 synthase
MERYKLILSYEGGAFSGSQRQARGRSVQAELEKALRQLGWKAPSLFLAGRTDAGVHAVGQVAACDLDWGHGHEALRDALNALLPWDLAVNGVQVAAADFHPRHDATARRYSYRIYCERTRDPLRERQAWRVWPQVKTDVLQELAEGLLGRHDFAAFGRAPRPAGSTLRTVAVSRWAQANDECRYEVVADAFLYRMVRRLVYVQVAAAQGRCQKEALLKALNGGPSASRLPAGLAPASGLVLVNVEYGT